MRIRANNLFMQAMCISQEHVAGTDSVGTEGESGDSSYTDGDRGIGDDSDTDDKSAWEKSRQPPLTAAQRAGLHEAMKNCGVKLNCMPNVYYAFIQRVAKTYVVARESRNTAATEDMHEDRDVACYNSVCSVMEEIPEDQRPHDGLSVIACTV